MIHNAGAVSLTTLVGQPGGLDILNSRNDQSVRLLHLFAQSCDSGTVWPAGGSITAFEQHETACDQICLRTQQVRETPLRRIMPLVAFIPDCQQTDCVQEDSHGWCSSCRAATSRWPD